MTDGLTEMLSNVTSASFPVVAESSNFLVGENLSLLTDSSVPSSSSSGASSFNASYFSPLELLATSIDLINGTTAALVTSGSAATSSSVFNMPTSTALNDTIMEVLPSGLVFHLFIYITQNITYIAI